MPINSKPKRSPCRLELVSQAPPSSLHPDLYEAFDHPLRPTKRKGRTYVYIIDTSKAAMSKAYLFERKLEIPMGTPREVEALGRIFYSLKDDYRLIGGIIGHTRLRDGDYLFSRSLHGSDSGMDDVLQAWVCGR